MHVWVHQAKFSLLSAKDEDISKVWMLLISYLAHCILQKITQCTCTFTKNKRRCHRWRSICEVQQPGAARESRFARGREAFEVARGGVTINVWDTIKTCDSLITTVNFAAEWLMRMYIMFWFKTAEHLCWTFPKSRRRQIDSYVRRMRLEPLNVHSKRGRLGSMWGIKSNKKCLKVKVN